MQKVTVNKNNIRANPLSKTPLEKPRNYQDFSITILPNLWQGEIECLVGPFSSQDVADYFADVVINHGKYEAKSRNILVKGHSWFISVSEA